MKKLIFSAFLIFGVSAAAEDTPCGPGVKGAPHSNGGGFVAATAFVAKTAFVGPKAAVCGYAKVWDNARISDNVEIFGTAEISGNVRVAARSSCEDGSRSARSSGRSIRSSGYREKEEKEEYSTDH